MDIICKPTAAARRNLPSRAAFLPALRRFCVHFPGSRVVVCSVLWTRRPVSRIGVDSSSESPWQEQSNDRAVNPGRSESGFCAVVAGRQDARQCDCRGDLRFGVVASVDGSPERMIACRRLISRESTAPAGHVSKQRAARCWRSPFSYSRSN